MIVRQIPRTITISDWCGFTLFIRLNKRIRIREFVSFFALSERIKHFLCSTRNSDEFSFSRRTIFKTCWAKLWFMKTASIPKLFAESKVSSSGGGSFAVSLTVKASERFSKFCDCSWKFVFVSNRSANLLVYRRINGFLISAREKKRHFFIEFNRFCFSYVNDDVPRINRSSATHQRRNDGVRGENIAVSFTNLNEISFVFDWSSPRSWFSWITLLAILSNHLTVNISSSV